MFLVDYYNIYTECLQTSGVIIWTYPDLDLPNNWWPADDSSVEEDQHLKTNRNI